eukprot:5241810-Pyramimonas_sp.AAC.1
MYNERWRFSREAKRQCLGPRAAAAPGLSSPGPAPVGAAGTRSSRCPGGAQLRRSPWRPGRA